MSEPLTNPTPYYRLDPDRVLQAIESTGLRCDGHLMALNSYENRVYQVGIEDEAPLVAKFYRPGRWSDDQILEEHQFSLALAEAEIPLVPPLLIKRQSLHHHEGFRFTLFARRGGQAPELDQKETRLWLGRFLARIHALGATASFQHRLNFDLDQMFQAALDTLEQGQWLPAHLEAPFFSLAKDLKNHLDAGIKAAGTYPIIRIHGDCHPGNILWRDGPFFVDLDDCRNGPAIQDLWMLLSGDALEMALQLQDILEGYEQFHHFNPAELHLIEPLRTLRMLHQAAWVANRWQDPAFPLAFPWFEENRYWEDLILGLREQLSRMQEPVIQLAL